MTVTQKQQQQLQQVTKSFDTIGDIAANMLFGGSRSYGVSDGTVG